MTLFKQIALLVSMMFLVLLTVILANNLRSAAEFQQGQLQTTAQDMATTLGITISNLPDGADAATLEVLFNAVFDSGYYSLIELQGVDGSLIHSKQRAAEIQDVPGWFADLVPLQPARGSTQVMRGWTQLGQLDLIVHPGFAYRGLFAGLVSTLRWFVVLFLVGMTLLWLV
ncbi:MAG: LapD/MoxY N-terminal periplasmic domain-containing protein, partial [Gammaproteobacteria bacterium]|nr:LapD/MoxY N-terminal periplasmic domain-containing protein [Gammaproteobacteria bacterium]